MPTYSYRCEDCGHEFERVQRMSEDPIKECPECHKQGAKRQISSANFILKGGGWYSDLYSGGSNKKTGTSSASSSSSTSASTSTSGSTGAKTESTSSTASTSTSTSTAASSSAGSTAPAK